MFEKILWRSRLVMVFAVFTAMISVLMLSVVTVVDLAHLLSLVFEYATTDHSHYTRQNVMLATIELLDGFLMIGVLLIFSVGLYELFVKPIDTDACGKQRDSLAVDSIDTLKSKLGKVILTMLIIKVFSFTLKLTVNSLDDLLKLAGVTVLIALAIFLSSNKLTAAKGK